MNVNPLTSDEMTEVVRKAYGNLSEEEQNKISRLGKILIRNMKKKYPKAIFGPDAALELLACLGMAINDNTLRLVK